MYLHEEYINRHNLDIPIVVHRPKSAVLLRSKNTPLCWRILAFYWHKPDRHPGFYDIAYQEAIHNGYLNARLLRDIRKIEVCHVDQYEQMVLEMIQIVRNDRFEAIEISEQILAVWQIFLMMYDSWLANNMKLKFFGSVERSLDDSISIQDRTKAIEEVRCDFCTDEVVKEIWLHQFMPLVKLDSEWLIRLINE